MKLILFIFLQLIAEPPQPILYSSGDINLYQSNNRDYPQCNLCHEVITFNDFFYDDFEGNGNGFYKQKALFLHQNGGSIKYNISKCKESKTVPLTNDLIIFGVISLMFAFSVFMISNSKKEKLE